MDEDCCQLICSGLYGLAIYSMCMRSVDRGLEPVSPFISILRGKTTSDSEGNIWKLWICRAGLTEFCEMLLNGLRMHCETRRKKFGMKVSGTFFNNKILHCMKFQQFEEEKKKVLWRVSFIYFMAWNIHESGPFLKFTNKFGWCTAPWCKGWCSTAPWCSVAVFTP